MSRRRKALFLVLVASGLGLAAVLILAGIELSDAEYEQALSEGSFG